MEARQGRKHEQVCFAALLAGRSCMVFAQVYSWDLLSPYPVPCLHRFSGRWAYGYLWRIQHEAGFCTRMEQLTVAHASTPRLLLKGSPTPQGGGGRAGGWVCGLWVGGLVWFGAIWPKVPTPPPPGGGVGSGWVGGWVGGY